jgi:hypothetical protein
MTKDYLSQIVSHYYDQLDYPDFIEFVKYKVIDTKSGVDISDIELNNYGGTHDITAPIFNNQIIISMDGIKQQRITNINNAFNVL